MIETIGACPAHMAWRNVDGDCYRNERHENEQRGDASQKSEREGDPEDYENEAAEPEQPRWIADRVDQIAPRRSCHPLKHIIMRTEVSDPADNKYQAGSDPKYKVDPSA